MEVAYQSIFEMPELGKMNGSDRLLVARGQATYYSSYSATLDMLSAQIYDDFVASAVKLSVISNESDLNDHETSRAVAGNIGKKFLDSIDALSSSTVKLEGDQSISGVKTFSKTPKAPTSAGSDPSDVANCEYVVDQIQKKTNTPVPMFSTAFVNQQLNFTISSSQLCPFMSNTSRFPANYTIYCIFKQTSTSKITPVFNVAGLDGTSLEVQLYAGTPTISSKETATESSIACYSCVVDDSSDVRISINNKNASVQVSLTIFAGSAADPRS